MKAVGYFGGTSGADNPLVDLELPRPTPGPNDLLVEIRSVSVNPVDIKTRASTRAPEGGRILGWDAVGIVAEIGTQVVNFKPGDRVYYAGNIARPGTNAEFNLVDYRIASKAPASLSDAEAAGLPLTTITAWEALFDRLRVDQPVPGAAAAILIIGGAGGVGSMAIQLARARTDLQVIATASRPVTKSWCREMGAHHVIDHHQPLAAQVAALGLGRPSFVFSAWNTDGNIGEIAELIAPQGRVVATDSPSTLDVMTLKRKAITFAWEAMFLRSLEETPDIGEQGALLAAVAALTDQGKIRSTVTKNFGTINASNLTRAHRAVAAGATHGKIVLEGF